MAKLKLPTNREKAEWARKSVRYYAKLMGEPKEPLKTKTSDLLADIMHMAHQKKMNFEEMLDMARGHFGYEIRRRRRSGL